MGNAIAQLAEFRDGPCEPDGPLFNGGNDIVDADNIVVVNDAVALAVTAVCANVAELATTYP